MKKRADAGFTLVEMLVVMAIISVLVGIAIAGLGFALRRARNIARQAFAQDMSTALVSYYADNQVYPGTDAPHELVSNDPTVGFLYEYMDEMYEPPKITYIYYQSTDQLSYSVCISQESAGVDPRNLDELAEEENWYCTGDVTPMLTNCVGGLGCGIGSYRNEAGADVEP
ncbi:MAG: type II secretion system protein [Patescibacteria group bacterium]|nr:type II secretion system protein [Patescibacteria group bacterium]